MKIFVITLLTQSLLYFTTTIFKYCWADTTQPFLASSRIKASIYSHIPWSALWLFLAVSSSKNTSTESLRFIWWKDGPFFMHFHLLCFEGIKSSLLNCPWKKLSLSLEKRYFKSMTLNKFWLRLTGWMWKRKTLSKLKDHIRVLWGRAKSSTKHQK